MLWVVVGLNVPALVWIPHLAQLITHLNVSAAWNLVGNLLPLSGSGCVHCMNKTLHLLICPLIFINSWIYNTTKTLCHRHRLTHWLTSLLTNKCSHLFPLLSGRGLHYLKERSVFFMCPFGRLVLTMLKVYCASLRWWWWVLSLSTNELGYFFLAYLLLQITCGNQLQHGRKTRQRNNWQKSIISDDWYGTIWLHGSRYKWLALALMHNIDACPFTAALG